jgi:deoxycytidine triphosphate deaminase
MPQLTAAQQRFLWDDPYPNEANGGGVLQATEIENYVNNYNLLIDQDDFLAGKLKQASYTMRPAANDAWMIEESGRYQALARGDEPRGPYYIVPKNSFVFIRLRQTLRLPFYIIGRHNLKIRYAYSGLLLGTGPQVDPGYEGQLYIPLHNFIDEDVKVYINESFVSIDFSRTSRLNLGPNPPTQLADFYETYEGPLKLIPREKITGRSTLGDYLGSNRPRSSLGPLVEELKVMRQKFEKRQLIEIGVAIGIVAIAIAAAGLVIAVETKIDANRNADLVRIQQAQSELTNSTLTNRDLQQQMNGIAKEVSSLHQDLAALKAPPPESTPSPSARRKAHP